MKLLLDCAALSIGGGIQVGLSVIFNALSEDEIDVHLYASKQIMEQIPKEKIKDISSITVFEKKGILNRFRNLYIATQKERDISPDVVFTVFGPSYWRSNAVSLQGFALGKMLYPESRDSYSSNFTRLKEKAIDAVKKFFLKKNADYFVVETDVVKQRLSSLLSIDEERIEVVENTYSPAFEKRHVEMIKSGNSLSLGGDFRFFIPSSFYQHKNLAVLPEVASIIKNKTNLDFRFVFTLDEDSYGWRLIHDKAIKFGVSKNFVSVGSVPNNRIADYYIASDAVVCSSLVESSTAVFPESFLAGKPLVVSDLDFAKKLCGDAALYFNPLDPKDVADKVFFILSSAKLRDDLVEKGYSRLANNYPNPDEKWLQQLNLIKRIANNGSRVKVNR